MSQARSKGTLLAAGFTVCVALAASAAASAWLSEPEIESALKGRTIDGVYAGGYRFSESYLDGGELQYTENGRTLHGHWSITQGTLCTIYDTDPTGGCFRVAPAGGNCFEFYFVARHEAQAPGPPDMRPNWTARGAVEGKLDACPEGANV